MRETIKRFQPANEDNGWKLTLKSEIELKKLKETNQNQVTCTKLRFFGTDLMEFAGSYFEFGRVSKDKWQMLQRWTKAKPRWGKEEWKAGRERNDHRGKEKEQSRRWIEGRGIGFFERVAHLII